MSAPKSKQAKMIKKFGKMAEQYEERIKNQQEIIARLTTGLTIAQGGLYSIENEVKDVRAARSVANQTSANMAAALEKKEQE